MVRQELAQSRKQEVSFCSSRLCCRVVASQVAIELAVDCQRNKQYNDSRISGRIEMISSRMGLLILLLLSSDDATPILPDTCPMLYIILLLILTL